MIFKTSKSAKAKAAKTNKTDERIPTLLQLVGEDVPSAIDNDALAQVASSYDRHVWKQGWLEKEGHRFRNWRRRYFILRGASILYYTDPSQNPAGFKGCVSLAQSSVRIIGQEEGDVSFTDNPYTSTTSTSTSSTEGTAPSSPSNYNRRSRRASPNPNETNLTPTLPKHLRQSSSSTSPPSSPTRLSERFSDHLFDGDNRDSDGSGSEGGGEGTGGGGGGEERFTYRFILVGPDRILKMAAESEEERREWVDQLQAAITACNYVVESIRLGMKPLWGIVQVLGTPGCNDLEIRERLTLDHAKAVAEVLRPTRPIVRMVLSGTVLTDGFMAVLAPSIAEHTMLQHVDLSNNRISDDGMAALVDALAVNVIISTLVLANNRITNTGATHIADLLAANVAIEHLDISANHISAAGAKQIAAALATNTSLQELVLAKNNIGDDGARELAKGLKQNRGVKAVDLHGNDIGEKGMASLCEGVAINRTLKRLNVAQNRFRTMGAKRLVQSLKEHPSLTQVDLGDNAELEEQGITTLADCLKSRYSVSRLVMKRRV